MTNQTTDTAPKTTVHILSQRNYGRGSDARRLAAAFRLAAYATRKGHTVTVTNLRTTNQMQYLCIDPNNLAPRSVTLLDGGLTITEV